MPRKSSFSVAAGLAIIGTLIGISLVPRNAVAQGPTNTPVHLPTVGSNRDWQPRIQSFDGVEMVLVPPGCFIMGTANPPASTTNAFENEKPSTRVCFDEPFWLDRTDVTQAQFKKFGGVAAQTPTFVGDNRPVDSINWFEARDYCAKRGARLPTEAEWEYAARGPDDLVYPWGDNWDPSRAIWGINQTVDVGTLPAGASWVGALDLSGNIFNWTSTLYRPYPYNADDGRESDTDQISARVVRGGNWAYGTADTLRSATRAVASPDIKIGLNFDGVRCARSANTDSGS